VQTHTQAVQPLYREAESHVRATFSGDVERVRAHYGRYVDFVAAWVNKEKGAEVLDVGCGNGWTTWLLRSAGYAAHGTDLHCRRLEAKCLDSSLPYTQADVQKLPFADSSFDAVAMYEVLEHVPDPGRALSESLRVVRPGGKVIVVGPNLLSVGVAAWLAWKQVMGLAVGDRRVRLRREANMAFHPFGNTLPEVGWHLGHHCLATVRKLWPVGAARFLMRNPDTQPPFHADNDACYFCCPMDLIRWARQQPGVRPLCWWSHDRFGSKWLWPIHGGTWVVLEKTRVK